MSDPRVLILGGHGMLGRALEAEATARGWPVLAAGRAQADVADPTSLGAAMAAWRPDLVVNAAAWTDVDGAEADEAGAARLNADAPGFVAAACREAGAALVHVSTDYVFPGTGRTPWRTDDPIDPVNAYGRTKAAGEAAVAASGLDRWYVARTAWLYDAAGRNFFTTIARLAGERTAIDVVDDQHGRPTAVHALAPRLLDLPARAPAGIHHCCDGGVATWFDFASAIVAGLGLDCTVRPCGTEQFPRPARRPEWGVLDLDATEAHLGPSPAWTDSLSEVIRRANRSD